jgi:DNA-binding MarR family transcriptional regulator
MGPSNDLHFVSLMETPIPTGPISPARLWTRASWLTNQVAHHAHRIVMEHVAETGMRKQHFSVLAAIDELGAPTQAALVRGLAIDGSDMVAVLSDLEGRGYVQRWRDDTDRRRNVIRLTPEGEAALARLDAQVEAAQDVIFAPLDDAEREQLRDLLARVLEYHRPRHTEPPPAA